MDPHKLKSRVALLSVGSNVVLIVGKTIVGLSIGSVSILSEAIHSGIDLVAAVIAFFAVRMAQKPADEDHPFGHGKAENISGTVEALLIFVAAIWIAWEAIGKLLRPEPIGEVGWGVAVMAASAVINFVVSEILFRVGRKTESVALQADAWHLRTDVWTSVGVLAALAVIAAGSRLWPGADLHWIDPAAALAVAALIGFTAIKLTMDSARDLMDAALPEEEIAWIRAAVKRHSPPVRGLQDLRTRRSGSERFIEFSMVVDRDLTVERSHSLTDLVAESIGEKLSGAHVTIHVEPCMGTCHTSCMAGCLLNGAGRLPPGAPPARPRIQPYTHEKRLQQSI